MTKQKPGRPTKYNESVAGSVYELMVRGFSIEHVPDHWVYLNRLCMPGKKNTLN